MFLDIGAEPLPPAASLRGAAHAAGAAREAASGRCRGVGPGSGDLFSYYNPLIMVVK